MHELGCEPISSHHLTWPHPLDGGLRHVATPLSRRHAFKAAEPLAREIGGFASPPCDGFALEWAQ